MRLRTYALAFAVAQLCACSGNGPYQPPLTTISGTVAANGPMNNALVTVAAPESPNGYFSAQSHTLSDGRYAATAFLGNQAPYNVFPPYLVFAEGALEVSSGVFRLQQPQYPRLYSLAHHGTANVTSLTDLLVARLLNRRLTSGLDNQAAYELNNRTETDVGVAREQVLAYLLNRPDKDNGDVTSPVDASAVADFISTPFNAVPGDPYFDALVQLHDSLMDSETIEGVEEHMLHGNDAPADLLAMLALDFMADCRDINTGAPFLGAMRITLDRRAITAGTTERAFQTGDQLTVRAGHGSQDDWTFTGFTISIRQGRLDNVVFSGMRCFPQSDVSVSGKHPSLTALVRLLRESISIPREFPCTGPITYPGFVIGQNTLAIDAGGALRINAPGGPALHLPSLNITIQASLTVTANQVDPIKPASFSAIRFLGSGTGIAPFDQFTLALTSGGQITNLGFQHTDGQSTSAQTCN